MARRLWARVTWSSPENVSPQLSPSPHFHTQGKKTGTLEENFPGKEDERDRYILTVVIFMSLSSNTLFGGKKKKGVIRTTQSVTVKKIEPEIWAWVNKSFKSVNGGWDNKEAP